MVLKMVTKSSKVLTPTVPASSKAGHRFDWEAHTSQVGNSLEHEFGLLMASLLANRGITTLEAAQEYLTPHYARIRNFGGGATLIDMDRALATLVPLLKKKARIVVFGDYDVDGVCGAVLLRDVFSRLGAEVITVLPHRERDGYGLQLGSIDRIVAHEPAAVVTVDNGILSHDAVDALEQKKIPVVIVDHHEPAATLPKAHAVLNPRRHDEVTSFRRLCATGVAFRLAEALFKEFKILEGQEKWLLDLVAVATVCDMMPLESDNRALVVFGLKTLQKTRRVGLAEMLTQSGSDQISAETIGFRIGPRLNAAGRLEHAQTSLDVLTTTDHSQAQGFLTQLEKLNRERQALTRRVVEEARLAASEAGEMACLVLANKSWSKGVCGLAASKIAEEFNRPTFILEEAELCVGSGRSVPGFDLAAALHDMSDLFVRAGGHAAAAGCTLKLEKLPEFRKRLSEKVLAARGSSIERRIKKYDATILLSEVDLSLLDSVKQLEPFGMGNPQPIFRFRSLEVVACRAVGADQKHASVTLGQEGHVRRAIAFGQAESLSRATSGARMDILAHVKENNWRGNRSAELEIIDHAIHD
jgi:single-stranded-DNA-specific exonuclease